ncbi:tetratricopeptide repeat-containing protein [filamentous cyanobacterium CCP2]|nr:tetratricopeptide repeat-containing protein [filamentous cyanobacterium CCP2]
MPPDESDNPDRQNQDTYEELLTAIESGQGSLSLLIAVCDDPVLREEMIRRYESDLAPEIQSYRLTLTRGEPSLSAAVRQTIEENEYLQQSKPAVLTLTGIELLHFLKLGKEKSEQETFFGYLQWTREALREFPYPIVIWLTYQNLTLLSRKSPDFWSWRKGVFRFMSRRSIGVPAQEFEGLQIPDFSSIDEETLIPLEDLKALIQQTERTNPKDSILATLCVQMGRVYKKRLEHGKSLNYQTECTQAIEYLQKAIGLQEGQEQILAIAETSAELAYLYQLVGRYSEAEPLLIRSLAIKEQQLGADYPATAVSLNNLAGLYYSIGRYSEAEPLLIRSLAIKEQQLGTEHLDTAATLNNLANLYRAMGRYGEAEPLYVRSLAICEQQLGIDHPNTVVVRENLGALRSAMAKPDRLNPNKFGKWLLDRFRKFWKR